MKRRMISLILILVLLLPTFAVSAFATVTPRGNGYESISFVYNGKNYSARLTTQFSNSEGGRTRIYTEAAVRVELGAPTVCFDTDSYGYQERHGKPAGAQLTSSNHVLVTDYVKFYNDEDELEMDEVNGYRYIYGTGTVIANGTSYSTTVYSSGA